jgi:GNAT superfamily N-acetyltransferase
MTYERPTIEIDVYEVHGGTMKRYYWDIFKRHHYLSGEFNIASRCFVGVWDGTLVAFNASLILLGRIPPAYEGDKRLKYRESRTVVLPDFQGLGIGTRFSNCIGEFFLKIGFRYFSKTAHTKMGRYRENSPLWRATSTNLKSREKSQKQSKKELWHHLKLDTKRLCYSHEYIGQKI